MDGGTLGGAYLVYGELPLQIASYILYLLIIDLTQ